MNVQVPAEGRSAGAGAWHEGAYRRGLYGGGRALVAGTGEAAPSGARSYGACLYSEL